MKKYILVTALIISSSVLLVLGVHSCEPSRSSNVEEKTYYIDVCPECDCQITRRGGSQTTLSCLDPSGHLTEVTVLNHQVKEK